jgi:hypothetical protein
MTVIEATIGTSGHTMATTTTIMADPVAARSRVLVFSELALDRGI